jgi:hypothetical protein
MWLWIAAGLALSPIIAVIIWWQWLKISTRLRVNRVGRFRDDRDMNDWR